MWVVNDPAVVRSVLLDWNAFPPDNALTAYTRLTGRSLRMLAAAGFRLPPTLASNSGASHRAIRATVARFFSPARVAAAEPLVRRLVEERIPSIRCALAQHGQADLVELMAADVPARALLQLIGLRDVDLRDLRRWSRDSLELFWGTAVGVRQEQLAASAGEYFGWLRGQVRRARRSPADDLFSALIDLGLDDDRVCATGYFLLIAGQETTSMLISTLFQRLVGSPAWRPIATDTDLLASVLDAALREESSVPTWRRTVREATELAGAVLPAGADLLLTLTGNGGSADAAFGVGVHRCLGAGLARLEARTVLQCTAAALPGLSLVEESPPRMELLSFSAPARVLVVDGGPSAPTGTKD
ncbi:MAG TPA: hypothetical protein VFP89_12020 [Propionibacteriaceae bacterium]|nr:hypothetical protein [Propionibacteriaceae bacterium]